LRLSVCNKVCGKGRTAVQCDKVGGIANFLVRRAIFPVDPNDQDYKARAGSRMNLFSSSVRNRSDVDERISRRFVIGKVANALYWTENFGAVRKRL
jgi:hypothetical protein